MASTPYENELQPGADENYEQRIKKRRGGHTHRFEGAIVPDPVADWEYVYSTHCSLRHIFPAWPLFTPNIFANCESDAPSFLSFRIWAAFL